MKNRFTSVFLQSCAISAISLLVQNAYSQGVVYNDSTSYSGDAYNFASGSGTFEGGQEVVLSGTQTADTISQFQVQYDFTGSGAVGTPTLDVQFFANTGTPTVNGAKFPNTLLWDAGAITLTAFTTGTAGTLLTYSVPNITVPQDFTWIATFAGLSSTESAGLSIFGATTVGANYHDAWVNNNNTGWSLQVASGSNPAFEFGATLTAVPEPNTIALGVMGACSAFFARRRKN